MDDWMATAPLHGACVQANGIICLADGRIIGRLNDSITFEEVLAFAKWQQAALRAEAERRKASAPAAQAEVARQLEEEIAEVAYLRAEGGWRLPKGWLDERSAALRRIAAALKGEQHNRP